MSQIELGDDEFRFDDEAIGDEISFDEDELFGESEEETEETGITDEMGTDEMGTDEIGTTEEIEETETLEEEFDFDTDIIDDGTSADSDGLILSGDSLLGDEDDYETVSKDADFISDTGDIVVMDTNENGDNFKLVYVDIERIAIVHRIRTNNNVEDLVRSIKSTGLLCPLVVAPTATEGLYVLLDGYRRILACAKAGKRRLPCIVNTKVNTPEIPILEALYNHSKDYSIKEMVDYIDYLEKEKGIMSASMIEYLLQMNNGDYSKLKDVLNDDDDDIVSKLFDGTYTIEMAFKKLEQRRKKESAEEKDIKKAEKVYGDEESSGADSIVGSGEETDDGIALSDEEIKSLAINAGDLDNGLEDVSLDEMVQDGKDTPGFEAHKQKVGEREYIDPVIRKTVMARDNFTCACCKKGGESYVDVLDYHHVVPCMLGGSDTPENGIVLCLTDHRLVHLYSFGDLHLPAEKKQEELDEMTEEERIIHKDEEMRFKRIVKLGQVIRDGMVLKGIKKDQYKKDHPIGNTGRNKPGKIQENA